MADSDGKPSRVSTGAPTLDEMLGGGYPENRATLVTGGPGTGKSTLGMQFLQAGLLAGDRCLYVTTEQTVAELRDSFAGYDFDLDHAQLGVASIHATPGETVEDEAELTLDSLFEDGEEGESAFTPPFEERYVQRHLERFAPRDRVVFDSISALAAISDRDHVFRRVVLDLVRLFSDEFGATSLFVAETLGDGPEGGPVAGAAGAEVQFSTHGVLRLWRELVDGDPHRYLRVEKMRGVDHDRRAVEVEFGDDGVVLAPGSRAQPPAIKHHAHAPVGVDGLDDLCGGGLVQGAGVLLQHDGRVNLSALFGALLSSALERRAAITLVPTIQLRPRRLKRILDGHGYSLEGLLRDDRLFVFDMIGAWDGSWPNVFEARTETDEVRSMLQGIAEQSPDPQFRLVNADAMAHVLGADGARSLRYFQESALLDGDDTLLHVQNPATVPDEVGSLYVDAADQVLETRLTDDGLQYLTLRKSPCGYVGSTSLVEYRAEPPYVAVQAPPADRLEPTAEEP